MRAVFIGLLISFSLNIFAFPLVPDLNETTGDLCDTSNHDFEGYRFREKVPVCRRDVSYELKQRVYDKYRIPKACRREYTIDHFYPLSMGGSNAEKNLWPEHVKVKQSRFELEQITFNQMTMGQLSQEQALTIIRNNKLNPQVPDISDPCTEKNSPSPSKP